MRKLTFNQVTTSGNLRSLSIKELNRIKGGSSEDVIIIIDHDIG